MIFPEVEVPSNKKFGFFFTIVFLTASGYFYIFSSLIWSYLLAATALIFLMVTVLKADILLNLNKLWMRFGLVLGIIISPIVLGIIFFGVFTPIAFLMRLNRRDELRLKFKSKSSHWISRKEALPAESFENQF